MNSKTDGLTDQAFFDKLGGNEESKGESGRYKRPPSKERGNGSRREMNDGSSSKRANLNKISKRQSIIQSILEESDDEETLKKLKNEPISPMISHEKDKTLPQTAAVRENHFASKSTYG